MVLMIISNIVNIKVVFSVVIKCCFRFSMVYNFCIYWVFSCVSFIFVCLVNLFCNFCVEFRLVMEGYIISIVGSGFLFSFLIRLLNLDCVLNFLSVCL